MNTFRTRAAAVATTLALSASSFGLAGCAASVGGVTCNFNVQNAHESDKSPGWMEGKATLKCTGAIESATGTVKLQRLVSGSWVDVPYTTFTREIAPVAANVSYTIMTADKLCANGTYRTAARGTGKFKGVPAQSIAWQYGNSSVITCK